MLSILCSPWIYDTAAVNVRDRHPMQEAARVQPRAPPGRAQALPREELEVIFSRVSCIASYFLIGCLLTR
jgi:hypothetical protein